MVPALPSPALLAPLVLAGVLLAPSSATASEWTAEAGISAFTKSRSMAIEHMTKPVVRVEGMMDVSDRLSLGGEVGTVLSDSASYRLVGATLFARTYLYKCDTFRLLYNWAWGVGTGPPILSDDLKVESDMVLWVHTGLDARWTLPGDRWVLGVGLTWEQLSVVTMAATVGMKL